jgi:hypothetical protein
MLIYQLLCGGDVKYRLRTRTINATGQHFGSYVARLTGSLETHSLSKSPRKTSLSFDNSSSGGTISNMKECEDIGFWLQLNWSDVTEHNSQICQG